MMSVSIIMMLHFHQCANSPRKSFILVITILLLVGGSADGDKWTNPPLHRKCMNIVYGTIPPLCSREVSPRGMGFFRSRCGMGRWGSDNTIHSVPIYVLRTLAGRGGLVNILCKNTIQQVPLSTWMPGLHATVRRVMGPAVLHPTLHPVCACA